MDSDHVIEARLGCPIRQYFEREGEERFRDVEAEVIDELTSEAAGCVVDRWRFGAAPGQSAASARARPGGLPQVQSRRSVSPPAPRPQSPAVAGGRSAGAPARPVRCARPLYRETAHFTIETGRPSVAMLVNMIVMQIELDGSWSRQYLIRTPASPKLGAMSQPHHVDRVSIELAERSYPDPDRRRLAGRPADLCRPATGPHGPDRDQCHGRSLVCGPTAGRACAALPADPYGGAARWRRAQDLAAR